jgi:hypothetical protein
MGVIEPPASGGRGMNETDVQSVKKVGAEGFEPPPADFF